MNNKTVNEQAQQSAQPSPQPEEIKIQPSSKLPILLAILGGVILIGAAIILASKSLLQPKPEPVQPPVLYVTTQPTQSQATDPTANWKTYRNEKYGFEFKYPAELLMEETSDTVTVYTENKISVHTMKPDTVVIPNFNLSLKRKPGALEEIIEGYPESEIKLGSNTYKWSFDGAEGTGYYYYYIQDKLGVWYEFSTYSPGFDNDVDFKDANNPQFWDTKKIVDILYQILSTFKFLE